MIGEITGESIKSAIALKLRSTFAKNIITPPSTIFPKVYKEKTVQGMKKPCFFIWTMDVGQSKGFRNNYTRVYQMNVRYHPEDSDSKTYETLTEIGIRLLESLNEITLPIIGGGVIVAKPVFGKSMSFNIVDDVLQLYVSYEIRAKKYIEEIPDMQDISIVNY